MGSSESSTVAKLPGLEGNIGYSIPQYTVESLAVFEVTCDAPNNTVKAVPSGRYYRSLRDTNQYDLLGNATTYRRGDEHDRYGISLYQDIDDGTFRCTSDTVKSTYSLLHIEGYGRTSRHEYVVAFYNDKNRSVKKPQWQQRQITYCI
jgi:hypothetical protein